MKRLSIIFWVLVSFQTYAQIDLVKLYFPELELKKVESTYNSRYVCFNYLVQNLKDFDSLHVLTFFNDNSILMYTSKGKLHSGKLFKLNKNFKLTKSSFYKSGYLYYSVNTDTLGLIEKVDSGYMINQEYYLLTKEFYKNYTVKRTSLSINFGMVNEQSFHPEGYCWKEIIYPEIGNPILKEFYKSGRLKVSSSDFYSSYHGNYIEYYENGSIKEIGQYNHGEKIGNWTYYKKNGKVKRFKKF